MTKCLISVIIPTLNSCHVLPRLLNSLERQSVNGFSVIIVDGGSCDETILVGQSYTSLNIALMQRNGLGIYDAINYGLSACTSDYYIVAGSDDYFYPMAIQTYLEAIRSSSADIVTAPIIAAGKLILPGRLWNPLKGPFSRFSSHSIGCAIRVDLHSRASLYTQRLRISADYLFLQRCLDLHFCIYCASRVVGYFSHGGTSSKQPLLTIRSQYHALSLSKPGRSLIYFWVPLARSLYYVLKSTLKLQ
jgi:glycosyltransferase involved in cell wall biosynthesis